MITEALQNGLDTWNEKIFEIWNILTDSLSTFRGGGIYEIIQIINTSLIGIGIALCVLFFFLGMMKSMSSFAELKRPEIAVKMFLRFVFTHTVVTQALDLMVKLFNFVQGIVVSISDRIGTGAMQASVPSEVKDYLDSFGWFDSIFPWVLALIGSLVIAVLSFLILLTIYSRFFKIYIFTAVAPIPLAGFAGETTSYIGRGFLKSYISVLFEGVVIILACVIFSAYSSNAQNDIPLTGSMTTTWAYLSDVIFNLLVLNGIIKLTSNLSREMLGANGG